MGSTGKKKTTMAKLARESRLRERRQEKEARKRARKDAAAYRAIHGDASPDGVGEDDLATAAEEIGADSPDLADSADLTDSPDLTAVTSRGYDSPAGRPA